ncbi:putative periplasmic solute-binding protein [Desulfosporosinus orientis DSM 765]|uniref:1,4-dihydroxy-6-naphtoate synthase n=1 Tax=Desulfosporosinus orientis (strain ATCC 19365 / DSM 765 / NCIMB 8382 / VKM B-1628 / Singapore I) TaxID=768706 RepID=G7WAD5_DESOD|nr:1,4-dihydroxy-6-naphthoate synthase [Desulfosporosinus orientis]AET66484.1 putative periplasmic solute-binding protein [Desulfosporosinus orientis DSM 765]
MKVTFSPCPNDTFVFHAWVHGLIPGAPKIDVTYADIDITNNLAAGPNGPDIVKISYAALPWVLSEYALLPCGGALGKGCGPLLLTSDRSDSINPAKLHTSRVAVPSVRSTAYLLFRLWAAQNVPGGIGEIIVLPFHEIMPAVRDGLVDAGLVIHEARFTYPSFGLMQMVDLGNWWEKETDLPIPLGAIIARRRLDLSEITHWIQASVRYAWAHPMESKDYVLQHSQELSSEVTQAHIKLYVNNYTENIGKTGYKAVGTLLTRAAQEGLVPEVDLKELNLF